MYKKFVGKVIVVLLAGGTVLNAATTLESSNGWGLPGYSGQISVIYATTDDWTAAFQCMLCFEPEEIQVDSISYRGNGQIQTVFDTAWGGVGIQYFEPYVDNDLGILQAVALYSLTENNYLAPMENTPILLVYWSVSEDAVIPTISPLIITEDCAGYHFQAVFSDTLGSDINVEEMIPGNFYVLEPGDANADGNVSLVDMVYTSNYLFATGAPPSPCGDNNADCQVNYVDLIVMSYYLFQSGTPPAEPACPWKKWPPSADIILKSIKLDKHSPTGYK